jgi:hypothetical protein
MARKTIGDGGWVVVMEGGAARMAAEQVRCLLAGRGLHPLVLNPQRPSGVLSFFGVDSGARVIVPPDEGDAARAILLDAGFIKKGDLPLRRIAAGRADAKRGGKRACGYCDAPADSGSVYCDQCGQPLRS